MKKNNKFVEEDNNDFYYMPISNDLIDYERLSDKLAYDVENLSLFFTSAFDDSFYNANENNQEFPSPSERQKQANALAIAVEHGANIEILKAKLTKILVNQRLEINEHIAIYKSTNKDITIEQIKSFDGGYLDLLLDNYQRTNILLHKAEELSKAFSPYEKSFN